MATLAAPTAPYARALTGAELAARIQIQCRLPVRYDGEPLRHLSHSSNAKFPLGPDDSRAPTSKASAPRHFSSRCRDLRGSTRSRLRRAGHRRRCDP